jgi:hypothetical protein
MCAILTMVASPAGTQKIETHKADQQQIVRVQTALNHLTVIEVSDPVVTVAAGSSAFKIEWRENKVFIQPTEPDVATNMFIWTTSGRLNYELEPAGSVEAMDFAIDHPAVPPPATAATVPALDEDPKVSVNPMLEGEPIRMDKFEMPKNRVVILLKDVYREENRLFIRYAVLNGSKKPYDPGTLQAFTLDVPPSSKLPRPGNHQLTDTEVKRLKSTVQRSARIVETDLRSQLVEPGRETVGVVGIELPAARENGHAVLRLVFPPDGRRLVSAVLVM